MDGLFEPDLKSVDFRLVSHVGQQCDLTCALDGDGQLTLMLCAGTGGTTGQNLAALGNVAAQLGSVLIVNLLDLVHAEGTDLSALTSARTSIISHNRNLLLESMGSPGPV